MFIQKLKEKLTEETEEVNQVKTGELPDELADVEEIVRAIAAYYEIPDEDIEKAQVEKRKKRDGFEKRLFLEYLDEYDKTGK